eukprot:TRINITY_DN9426_c0_g1_i1.p1 TRINITY_DN9426_c0_g1~~TRINITY_DN9426_c0_g1_i1.p1  ORF type:complete len:627 (-),score=80.81 TRINITY_DN9426_c0_g1_i1:54-1934(-)
MNEKDDYNLDLWHQDANDAYEEVEKTDEARRLDRIASLEKETLDLNANSVSSSEFWQQYVDQVQVAAATATPLIAHTSASDPMQVSKLESPLETKSMSVSTGPATVASVEVPATIALDTPGTSMSVASTDKKEVTTDRIDLPTPVACHESPNEPSQFPDWVVMSPRRAGDDALLVESPASKRRRDEQERSETTESQTLLQTLLTVSQNLDQHLSKPKEEGPCPPGFVAVGSEVKRDLQPPPPPRKEPLQQRDIDLMARRSVEGHLPQLVANRKHDMEQELLDDLPTYLDYPQPLWSSPIRGRLPMGNFAGAFATVVDSRHPQLLHGVEQAQSGSRDARYAMPAGFVQQSGHMRMPGSAKLASSHLITLYELLHSAGLARPEPKPTLTFNLFTPPLQMQHEWLSLQYRLQSYSIEPRSIFHSGPSYYLTDVMGAIAADTCKEVAGDDGPGLEFISPKFDMIVKVIAIEFTCPRGTLPILKMDVTNADDLFCSDAPIERRIDRSRVTINLMKQVFHRFKSQFLTGTGKGGDPYRLRSDVCDTFRVNNLIKRVPMKMRANIRTFNAGEIQSCDGHRHSGTTFCPAFPSEHPLWRPLSAAATLTAGNAVPDQAIARYAAFSSRVEDIQDP